MQDLDVVIPPVFDRVPKYFSGERAIVEFQGKQGIIDRTGKLIVPFMFDFIDKSAKQSEQNYVLAAIDGRTGITDLDGNTIVPFEFYSIQFFNQLQNYVVASKGKWSDSGIANLDGETIIPFEYSSILSHNPDITLVTNRNAIGVVNRQAKFVPLLFSQQNTRLDEDEFIPAIYPTSDDNFINDLAFVSYQDGDRDRYCVVNRQGQLLVASQADTLEQRKMDDSLCQIVAGQKPDYDLSKAVEALSDTSSIFSRKAYGFNSGLFQISINGKNNYVNLDGELVPWLEKFDQIGNFSEGLAPFVKDNRYGFISPEGEVAFYLDAELVAASYSSKPNNHYIHGTDWVFIPKSLFSLRMVWRK